MIGGTCAGWLMSELLAAPTSAAAAAVCSNSRRESTSSGFMRALPSPGVLTRTVDSEYRNEDRYTLTSAVDKSKEVPLTMPARFENFRIETSSPAQQAYRMSMVA